MDLTTALERVDAPEELLDWHDRHRGTAWQDCPRPDWLLWIGACSGTPVAPLLEAASECVRRAVEAMPGGTTPLLQALQVARRTWHTEAPEPQASQSCVAAARRCDAALRSYPETYRSTMLAGYPAAARAAGWLARAAEGWATAEARAEAERIEEGRSRALTLGAHPDIMVPARSGPAVLDPEAPPGDPVQEELTYAIAAGAEAVDEAANALAPSPEDAVRRGEVRATFADQVRQTVAALRGHRG